MSSLNTPSDGPSAPNLLASTSRNPGASKRLERGATDLPGAIDIGSRPGSSSERPRLPPPFSSLDLPPPFSAGVQLADQQPKPSVTEPSSSGLPAFTAVAGAGESSLAHGPSTAEAEVKAALPQDLKRGQERAGPSANRSSSPDQEPPPPYEEGDSPLVGFTYKMAAAGGAASIITQVQQGAPAPVNTLSGGYCSTDGRGEQEQAS